MKSLEFISQIALIFIKNDDFDFKIKNSLNKIGDYFKASRIYIFLDNETGTTISNKHEWCNKGIAPQIDKLQNISYKTIPSWKYFFGKEGNIYYENIKDLPLDIASVLASQGIFSIIIKPLYIENKKYGFIGFDECKENRKWSQEDKKLLETTLNIIEAAYKNYFFQKKVKDQKKKLQNIIEGSRLGTWEWKVQTGEVVINERWLEIIGYTTKELTVDINTWKKYVHPEDLKRSNCLLQEHFKKKRKYYSTEARIKHKNGNWVWIFSRGKVIKWDLYGNPVEMFGIHIDITEKKQLEEMIRESSIRDSLTNIYNRRYIFKQLKALLLEFLETKNNFIISIIDIDYFKTVNDKYGHQAGDFTLKEFAKIIKKNIRATDLFGRYGGEEFIIISKNIKKMEATLMVERILEITRKQEFIYRENKIKFTFSCGISECEEIDKKEISVEKIIEKADLRLYMAKNKGRNRVINFN